MNVNIITAFSLIAISIGAIQKITYLMVYLYIYGIPFDRLRAYFTKTTDDAEEQEELRRILPEEPVASSEEKEPVASSEEAVASVNEIVAPVVPLENDATVWYKFADGKGRYKGEWKNGLPNGNGIKHSYKDDSYIYGNFVDGYTEGYGKQTFGQTWEKTQPYYEGEFKRNNYDGKGEYHYGDGDYYKGDWKDSKYN